MSKAIYYPLVAAAAVVAGTGAVKAAPIAIASFGSAGGWLLTAGISATIFAGWHTAFDSGKPVKARDVGLAAAVVFSAASILAINSSSAAIAAKQATEQAEIKNKTIEESNRIALENYQDRMDAEKARIDTENAESRKAWQAREEKRLAMLEQVTEEMRSTSKKKNPSEYAALLEQMTALQVAEPQPAKETAEVFTAPVLAKVESIIESKQATITRWVQSAAYEVVAPVLLLLASFYRPTRSEKSGLTGGNSVQSASENVIPMSDPMSDPAKIKHHTAIDPLKAIIGELIPSDQSNGVTNQAIMAYAHCGERKAKNARDKAVKCGALIKAGEGASTRYVYPKDAPRFQLSESDKVISIEGFKQK
ncbi:hypothetical protein VSS37_03270 [Candidatus Thiothrix sp. Deng01]|uniref:Uncharacterized protein n=1 Tax=Candidatus Thiothrix phosphatis TaxID=3112415 RepID=A0ABU6CT28_9GAMM|nr:hypothetical protein [Candidatus Thiothrix sp. Deng01]MEB4589990.1 hypothetical protein [Candidatus Thiothrix sp. Deng01]